MDNHLTPNKIQRLMRLAQDKSFNLPRPLLNDEEIKRLQAQQALISKSTVNCESSSGLLDLDLVEAIEECESVIGLESEYLCTSTAFNAGEMTGRSTGTEEAASKATLMGRNSLAIESITSQMNKQTNEIKDLMRHSICTEYSFQSKRDLTADEASLVQREAPLPIQQTTQTYFPDSMLSNSNLSVGAYFQNRCPEFTRMLGKTDSPDRSAFSNMPSITEVSASHSEHMPAQIPQKFTIDDTLDCVPVRQPRLQKLPEKLNINNPNMAKNYEKPSFHPIAKIEQNNDTYNKASEHDYSSISKTPEIFISKNINPVASSTFASHKVLPSSCKPTDVLIRNLQASMKMVTDDTEGSAENSLSISKIADYLGKESNVSVTGILQLKNQRNPPPKKQPLAEVNKNFQEKQIEQVQVTNLRDTRKVETASSAGTINTVISLDKLQISQEKEIPFINVTSYSHKEDIDEYKEKKRSTTSKSPSSKSHSTLSTVQENFNSFKSGDSPLQTSKDEAKNTHALSPNLEYRELDKSVDWREVLQQKRLKQESLAKEQWADLLASPVNGFVGGSCPVTITVTTVTDSWLTAKLQFDNLPNDGKDLTIELPRLPLLLSPGKSEQFTLHITSYVEMNTTLSYTIYLKDASIDCDVEQKGNLDVNIRMPVIQAMSCDGVNKVTFPPIQEKSSLTKSFVLISDCPVDLQLDLSVVDSDNIFTIQSVQEIKKSDVNKVLTDQKPADDGKQGKAKSKGMNKQLCRLTSGNAIRVTIKFSAPQLTEPQKEESIVSFSGALNVNLLGVNTVLRKVELVGKVGTVNLFFKMPTHKPQSTNETTNIAVGNTGSVTGAWVVKFANPATDSYSFKVAPTRLDIKPGAMKQLAVCYTGPDDVVTVAKLIFEDLITGKKTLLEITAGENKPLTYPIRTNHNIMSWVRPGRKELSLKNCTNKKVNIRCQVLGEGFSIDLPGLESRGIYGLSFGPNECRPLPIVFNPVSNVPHSAMLHLACDKNNDLSRKVKLFGSSNGEGLRWLGLVTYGETALVRAVSHQPVSLELYNKTTMPAFVAARLHFNLQYTSISSSAVLRGGRRVVPARSRHALTLAVDWSRVERRARAARTEALATITVLTGAELTRRRILRVLRDKSNGVVDTSTLDDHLKVLAGPFEGEDVNMDNMLADFNETTASLNELIGGLHELTAHIILPQDIADENSTIVVTDDTVVEHHTLCD